MTFGSQVASASTRGRCGSMVISTGRSCKLDCTGMHSALNHIFQTGWLQVHVDLLSVQLRHLYCLRDQVIQSVRLLIDDRQQFALIISADFRRGEHGRSRCLDGGQRSAKLVCDRVQHQAAQPLALFCGFTAGRIFQRLRPVNRDRNETSKGLKRLIGENGRCQQQCAAGTHACPQRNCHAGACLQRSDAGTEASALAVALQPVRHSVAVIDW